MFNPQNPINICGFFLNIEIFISNVGNKDFFEIFVNIHAHISGEAKTQKNSFFITMVVTGMWDQYQLNVFCK